MNELLKDALYDILTEAAKEILVSEAKKLIQKLKDRANKNKSETVK